MLMLQIAESHGQREVSQIHIWINLCLKKRPIQWKLLFYVSTTHDHKHNSIISFVILLKTNVIIILAKRQSQTIVTKNFPE